MPLMSWQAQEQIAFSVSVHKMKVALEGIQRAVSLAGRSITKTWTAWRESMEAAGIDVAELTGVRYEKPVIIDDPPPLHYTLDSVQIGGKPIAGLRDAKIELTNNIVPHYSAPRCRMSFEPIVFKVPVVPPIPLAAQARIADISRRVLAELGPGPGRDA